MSDVTLKLRIRGFKNKIKIINVVKVLDTK